jgi:hypothetical protein
MSTRICIAQRFIESLSQDHQICVCVICPTHANKLGGFGASSNLWACIDREQQNLIAKQLMELCPMNCDPGTAYADIAASDEEFKH